MNLQSKTQTKTVVHINWQKIKGQCYVFDDLLCLKKDVTRKNYINGTFIMKEL